MRKYSYVINNLDCADCARVLEERLNKSSKLKDVVVNFSTSRISFLAEDITIEELNKLLKKIDPNVYVLEKEEVQHSNYYFSVLIVAVFFGVLGFLIDDKVFSLIFMILGYMLLLYRPFINALKMLVKSHTINENALISISCIGAFIIGEVMEGLMVVALYTLGKILEEKAINNTRTSIKSLLDIKQDYANLKMGDSFNRIAVTDIKVGDVLVVKKGERIPVDGVIKKGKTSLDMAHLTGEASLVLKKRGDLVLSGSVNMGDVIYIKATELYENSMVSKILELTMNAASKKAHTETLVSKFSKIYTPVVLLLAILAVFILPLFGIGFSESIYRGLTFLVIACPCAIAISVPLAYFTGIGVASKKGILIKGSNYLDNLIHLKRIIFDKTGTLTTGFFKVRDIEVYDNNYTKDEVIEILAKGESLSNHPVAKSILELYKGKVKNDDVSCYEEILGKGIKYKLGNKLVKVGSRTICNDCSIDTSLHLNIDGVHVASINLDDGIKEGAFKTIAKLKALNILTYMFTGDKKEVALSVGNKLKIDKIEYEMLPEDKYKEYEKLANLGGLTAFVGDGINDAPVLKRADIGISMGNAGSGSAIEASDIVIMTDDLEKITEGIAISRYTNDIIKQNLIFAIGVKVLILILSLLGVATMWFAVFADTGVTLLAILNTLRIMTRFK